MVARYREDPHRFYQASWAVAQKPGAEEAKYRLALRQAETAYRLVTPEDPWYRSYLNTLGIAQYRVGQHADALDSLKRADTLFSAQSKGGVYYNLAFLAMTQHRLGRTDDARASLTRLRELLPRAAGADREEAEGFLREAEAVVRTRPGGPGE